MAQDPNAPSSNPLSYRAAGVDIDAGNRLVERIKPLAAATFRPGVLSGLGGFGALFELPPNQYRHPVLVSGTDGVGTKLKLAIELDRLDQIGIDLVAMCVNDILVTGAEPLFFLDYYATGRLDVDSASRVVAGIAEGCRLAGCALTGGETAEMPGMYSDGEFDLAGFCVGVVEKSELILAERVHPGDRLIGLASSGPHSNGYSLIRKLIATRAVDLTQELEGVALATALLAPTRIYVRSLLPVIRRWSIHGLAHITGGGLTENLPRMLPDGARAVVDLEAWQRPALFRWLQRTGDIDEQEMRRTFNCGLGMVVCVADEEADAVCEALNAAGEQAWIIGHIEAGAPAVCFVGGGD
ncbi:phosphoribosylformylglycinamidine cyclo-ligase [Thioalkalicoccus limnaeus]|uniref:Phosphoribosylformylglycinamidine cyclo-ligase n=1 Tax=Thioalkalicoccus limnaeus TaxID=120681 RepID=A0ABV4BDM9_9GAMM